MPVPDMDTECFFIAPIGDEGSDIRERSDGVLNFIVSKAAEELDLTAVRADQIAEPGQITLQVIDHLINARAAVADLTGNNANVFYELAVRHTAKLPTVLIAEEGSDLPFDIAQMRTIMFNHQNLASADNAREQIIEQLRTAMDGAVDSPIATAVDLRSLDSGTAVERTVLDLASSIDGLSRGFTRLSDQVQDQLARRSRPDFHPEAIEELERRYMELIDIAVTHQHEDLDAIVQSLSKPIEYIVNRHRDPRHRSRFTSVEGDEK